MQPKCRPNQIIFGIFPYLGLNLCNLCKFSYISQSPILVDIPWPVPKLERTNMMSTHQFNRFKDSTPMFWLLGSGCMDLCLYRVQTPKSFPYKLSLGLVLEYLSTQVLSLSTHNKYL